MMLVFLVFLLFEWNFFKEDWKVFFCLELKCVVSWLVGFNFSFFRLIFNVLLLFLEEVEKNIKKDIKSEVIEYVFIFDLWISWY